MTGHSRLALAAIIFFLGSAVAPGAQQHNWSGCHFGSPLCDNPNPAWGDPLNWFEGAPHAGANIADDLVFANAARQSTAINTFTEGTRFRSITIGAPHQLFGNAITLDAGISASVGAIIQLPITLNARQTFSVSTAGASLVFQGATINTSDNILDVDGPGNIVMISPIIGANALIKEGTGTLQFVGNQPYTGLIQAEGGTVRISGDHSAAIFVDGATFGGAGTVQGIRSSEGFPEFIIAPGGTAPNETAIINSTENVNFRGPGTFAVDLKGTTAGMGYDQLNVTGSVSILSTIQRAGLTVTLVNFAPNPGDSFVIVNNDGTDPIQGGFGSPGEFHGLPEGSSFLVGNTTFFITYQGGDGNDIVLHVPATRTWDGGGADANWATAANWVGDIAPEVGDALVFPASAARKTNTNNLPEGTLLNSITLSGSGYNLQGNSIALLGGITDTSQQFQSNAVTLSGIILKADQVFAEDGDLFAGALSILANIDTNGHRLTLQGDGNLSISGIISGTGGVTVTSTGEFKTLSGGGNPRINTYTGATVVTSGDLFVRASQPSSAVQLMGGILSGPGVVGQITATGGTVELFEPMGVVGGVNFSSSSTFKPDVGWFADDFVEGRLDVAGSVQLNNSNLLIDPLSVGNREIAVGDLFTIINNDGGDPVQGVFAGLPEGASRQVDDFTFKISYSGGDGNDVTLLVTAAPPPTPPKSSLGNISTRLRVQAGDNVLIGGMIVTGTAAKKIIVRAIGPTLADLGVPGALSDPTLELFQGNVPVASNDDWVSSPQQAEIASSGFAPNKDAESAIIATLMPNQNYTAIVRGKSGQTGVGLVEAFDLDPSAASKLANISTRGFVDVDDNVMIAGLIVAPIGGANTKVLARALGPTLGDFGVQGFLANPTLDLVGSNGTVIRSSNDWKDDGQRAAIEAAQLAPTHDEEAALIESLAPGAYTAIVRGNSRTTGVGLVEVYNIP